MMKLEPIESKPPNRPEAFRALEANPEPITASLWRRLARSVPTVLVFVMLAGIGAWGHHHGWKIPKFSEMTQTPLHEGVAWCEAHGVAEAECISCNAELMPKGELFGWCREHGVHECVLHHPELAQLAELPKVPQADFDRAARALALRPRRKNDSACKMHLRRIQFPSRAAADRSGIDINLVDRGPIVESISVAGEILYDPTRVARISTRASGVVWGVEKQIGNRVREGEIMAYVDAAEVGRDKADLLQAVAQLHLHDKTLEKISGLQGVVPGKRLLEAEAARAVAEATVRRAVQALQNLGLSIGLQDLQAYRDAELAEYLRTLGLPPSVVGAKGSPRQTANLIPILAPREGVVVARDVVAGEVVDTTKTLFTIADTSWMWLVLNVPMEEIDHVHLGQKVLFHSDARAHVDQGELTWISTEVDNETRTVKVRGELLNDDLHLRNETFGVGEILLREEPNAILAPSSAVHWEGCCHVVFVRDKDYMKEGSYQVFHTRSIRPGMVQGEFTEILAGLLPGEVIVTRGSGILRAELLKGNLGAG